MADVVKDRETDADNLKKGEWWGRVKRVGLPLLALGLGLGLGT